MHQLIVRILDEIRGAWRFRWHGMAVAWGVCLLGWAYVIHIPDVFEASTRVYVDTQSALRPLLKGLAVEPDVDSDLAVVRQALLSRPRLSSSSPLTKDAAAPATDSLSAPKWIHRPSTTMPPSDSSSPLKRKAAVH